MGRQPRPVVERFAEKIALTSSGCVEWLAGTNGTGYGTFYDGARATFAHRWSYEHHVGPIPAGLCVDHLCSNRTCVNPGHLELVTQAVNLARADSIPARNAAKTHCPAGHEYAGRNLMHRRDGRHCRTCHNDRRRKAA